MHIRLAMLALAAAVGWGATLAAHHSLAKVYRENERVTIEGELVTLVYRNPHSYLHVMAPDRQAHPRLWAVESVQGQQLRQALSAATLKPGDRLVVTGAPGLDDGEWRMRLRTIFRPRDGWRWSEDGPRSKAERGVGRWGPTSAQPGPGEGPRSER